MPMTQRAQHWHMLRVRYERDALVIAGMMLVALCSFALGYHAAGQGTEPSPIIIEMVERE
jgi:hypothetical protein